jgi:hypothetical protein
MSYARMDHAGWMESNNRALNRVNAKRKGFQRVPEELTDFQKRVVDIVGMVGGGIYNAPISTKIDWKYSWNGVSFTWHREMATWDFDQLTRLVFLCHEARIRCQIESAGPKLLRLTFWEREATGDMSVRHPNLDEAVRAFREYLPADHRIIYREPVTAEADPQ